MYVTRHSAIVDRSLRDRLWTLYARAYRTLAEEAPTREMLDRDEFDDHLADGSNRAWVVWEDGRAIAMVLVATNVRRTRWLSTAYFERTHPELVRAGRVHYVVWAVVDPDDEARGAGIFLARQAMAVEAREGALLVFDLPESNQPEAAGGAAAFMHRVARMVGGAELVPLTVQRYYALDFSNSSPSAAEERGEVLTNG